MKHELKIVFGKEQVLKLYNDELFTDEEKKLNIKSYFFDTFEERNIFLNGIEEAIGWTDYHIQE